MSLDDEWCNFLDNDNEDYDDRVIKSETDNNLNKDLDNKSSINDNSDIEKTKEAPKSSDIYVSTKTKIIYLDQPIDIYNTFWSIPIIDYDSPEVGIIKKQVKISLFNKEEINEVEDKLSREKYVINKIINNIDNPDGRVKFKHIRKISIGISKKDLIYSKSKDKSAFYNCFVITLRIIYNSKFKEIHIKVFNTGKLEIPGIQKDDILENILNQLLKILSNITKTNITYNENFENILINSNFTCGYYINREALFNILRHKYNINATYDPCSYPGIQCIYYYDNINNVPITETLNCNIDKQTIKNKNIIKISYMIFRTGSILIVGKCDEIILNYVYDYVKDILYNEYINICTNNNDTPRKTKKNERFRKKIIYIK
jgi:hypothetical protein